MSAYVTIMIKKIIIADVATYPHDPSTMNDLTKINFVYGTNGSGKTTISNFLGNNTTDSGASSIEWQNNIPLKVYVYNKAFRESHFCENIPGIFTLGKATNEEIKAIEQKKAELEKLKKDLIALSNTLNKKQDELNDENYMFSEWCWSNVKAKYEDWFRNLMQGALNSKSKHSNKVFREISKQYEGGICTIENLKSRAETLFKSTLSVHDKITIIDYSKIAEIENATIWKKKIVGKADVDIATLISRLNIFDWVNQGRNYISEDSDICPFCQAHTINKEFIDKIEKLFDDQYSIDANNVESFCYDYETQTAYVLSKIEEIIQTERDDNISKIDLEKLSDIKNLLISRFSSIKQNMDIKRRELSRSIDIEDTSAIFLELNKIIRTANDVIEKHNRQVMNVEVELKNLNNDFWHFIQEDNKIYLTQHLNKVESCQKAISELEAKLKNQQDRYDKIDSEIREDNKKVTSVQSSVDDINKMLKLYGFTNFSIVSAGDNQYQIKRSNGDIANSTLSEGEVTFITFLYFMQLVIGGESAEEAQSNRVVVIDDPISSLDSMVLYVVSAIVKSLIKTIEKGSHVKQLIILTHNIFFHKEVSFIDGRDKEKMNYSFWVVSKKDGISSMHSYGHKNPIKSSYEMLWEDVKNWEKISATSLQNTMRRIYETYFRVLGRMSDEDIIKRIEDAEEKKICLSLIGWINDGSHTIPDDYYIVPSDEERERYLGVFRKIFEKMGHIDHYNMMMGIKGIES